MANRQVYHQFEPIKINSNNPSASVSPAKGAY